MTKINKYKKGETNNNVPKSNTLKSYNIASPNTCRSNTSSLNIKHN